MSVQPNMTAIHVDMVRCVVIVRSVLVVCIQPASWQARHIASRE
jgi:hypothetical protein